MIGTDRRGNFTHGGCFHNWVGVAGGFAAADFLGVDIQLLLYTHRQQPLYLSSTTKTEPMKEGKIVKPIMQLLR